ncbi:hypothetical protein B0H11DRAFT_1903131 [Mycena galericulata]|nr:hypothetical protein B0H11DRAFT_1903131 [Mycena galericulata]
MVFLVRLEAGSTFLDDLFKHKGIQKSQDWRGPVVFASSRECDSRASNWQFDHTNHANITTGDRSFLVHGHIPADYDPTTPHALVVSFHAFKANDKKQELITGFSEGADLNGRGLVAVYPNNQFGAGKNGNESIRAWQGAPPGVDDLSQNLCLDANRFYASLLRSPHSPGDVGAADQDLATLVENVLDEFPFDDLTTALNKLVPKLGLDGLLSPIEGALTGCSPALIPFFLASFPPLEPS